MRRATTKFGSVEHLEARRLLAINLVADINQVPLGSRPAPLVALGDDYFFHASTGPNSDGLWKFDPSTKSSTLIHDDLSVFRDSFEVVNERLFFKVSVRLENGGRRNELWATDGTAEGTRSLHEETSLEKFLVESEDFDTSMWNEDWNLVDFTEVIEHLALDQVAVDGPYNLGGTIMFALDDTVSGGKEFWRTDGTLNGTEKYASGIDFIGRTRLVAGGKLYFNYEQESTGLELWVTDGTEVGTRIVQDIVPGTEGQGAIRMHEAGDGALLFTVMTPETGVELWRTDGTERGTDIVADIATGAEHSNPNLFWNLGDTAFFTAETAETGNELWSTNSATGITTLVADTVPGPDGGGFQHLGNTSQGLMFVSDRRLWVSDGTEDGTRQVTDFQFDRVIGGAPYGDRFAFTASFDGFNDRELWVTDGSSDGTYSIDILQGSEGSEPSGYVAIGEELYFTAKFGAGRELFVSDGTQEGTRVLQTVNQFNAGSDVRPLAQLPNGKMLALADNGISGPALFSVDRDGSFEQLVDYPGTRFPAFQFAVVGDQMYFDDLWVTDGTSEGTRLITSDFPLYDNTPFEVVGDTFYFPAHFENSVWLVNSDGTRQGTRLVKNLGDLEFFEMREFRGQLMFKAADDLRGEELWITDGTPAGTQVVKDLVPGAGGSRIRSMTSFDGKMYFLATLENEDGQPTSMLVESDGTEAGTRTFLAEDVGDLVTTNDLLLFTVSSGNQVGIWRSDGTFGGTIPLGTQNPSIPIRIGTIFGVDRRAYFQADGQWWVTDGTPAGTNSLPWFDTAEFVFPWNGKVLARIGQRLFESNGTEEGTLEIDTSDVFVETVRFPVVADAGFYVQVQSPATGTELYLITPEVESTPQVVDFSVERNGEFELRSTQFEFSEFVWPSLTPDDLLILQQTGTSSASQVIDSHSAVYQWDFTDNTATWNLAELQLGYGVYEFEIGRNGVYDFNNNLLDGNADGRPGGAFRRLVSNAIPGDVDLDGVVDFADFLLVSSNFGNQKANWLSGDLDGDAKVGFADFLILSGNFGASRGQ